MRTFLFIIVAAFIHPAVADTRPYPGLRSSLERLTQLLDGSALWSPGAARNLQDPLTFRGLPQVLGALWDTLDVVRARLAVELNAANANPLVIVEDERVISVSNLDVVPPASLLAPASTRTGSQSSEMQAML